MRRILTTAVTFAMALAMLTAPDMAAQTRSRGNSGGTTTRSSQSTTRSSGASVSRSSGSSASRSSGAVQQDNRSRSTGTATRSTGSSTSRSSGSVQQDNRSRGTGTTTRSSGSSTSRSSGSVQQDNRSRGTGTTTRSSGSSTSRSSGSATQSSRSSGSSATRSSGTTTSGTRSSGTTTRSSGSATSTRSSGTSAQQDRRSSGTRSSSSAATGGTVRATNASRGGLSGNTSQNNAPQQQEPYRDNGYNYRYNDDFRVDNNHEMYRVAPRLRDPLAWDRPGYFWGDHPHYYGYRIHSLPPHWRRITHWGIDYYYYNGIYYRPFGGSYVICRPPFGTPLEAAIDRAILRAIRFAYYCDTYRTYNTVFDNYNVIARQNLIIAQNNARIAAQHSNYALNASRALSAYELANMLGLVQSYAYANSEYFYQDGVFYTVTASGSYSTIVPPAGALVTSLPDDYEIIVMNGIEYYLVDNTVYRTTVFEGEPFLEVLGQMYGSLYNQYNIYR